MLALGVTRRVYKRGLSHGGCGATPSHFPPTLTLCDSLTFIPLKEKNNCNRDASAEGNTMAAPANATSVVDAQYVSSAVVSYLQEGKRRED